MNYKIDCDKYAQKKGNASTLKALSASPCGVNKNEKR